jgi:hypothetical protein
VGGGRSEYETARDLLKTLAEQYPGVPEYRHNLANTHLDLGVGLGDLGQWEAARSEYKKAHDVLICGRMRDRSLAIAGASMLSRFCRTARRSSPAAWTAASGCKNSPVARSGDASSSIRRGGWLLVDGIVNS